MLGGQDETEAGIYSLFAEGETCVAPDYLISRAAKRGLRGVTKRKLNEVLIKCEGLDAYKNPLWADDGLPALLNALSAASSQTNASDTPLAAPQTDDSSSDNGGPASQVGA